MESGAVGSASPLLPRRGTTKTEPSASFAIFFCNHSLSSLFALNSALSRLLFAQEFYLISPVLQVRDKKITSLNYKHKINKAQRL